MITVCPRVLWLLVAATIATDLQLPSYNDDGLGTQPEEVDTKQTLYLLSFLPYPADLDIENSAQPVWSEGPSVYLAANLAVELINNNSDILSDYTLELIQGRGGCNIVSRTSIALTKHVFHDEGKQVLGILGPGCSASGLFVSGVVGSNQSEVPRLTVHLGSSQHFSNRSAYPYSFSMLASANTVARAITELMQNNNWKDIIVLYDESQIYFVTLLEQIEQSLNVGRNSTNLNIPIASLVYENYIPFSDIRRSQKRIVLLMVGSDLFSRILCVSFRKGLSYPTYQWVFVTRVVQDLRPVNIVYEGVPMTCQLEELLDIATQSIFVLDHFEPLNVTKPTVSGLTYEKFMSRYECLISSQKKSRLQSSFWGTVYFDATWAMALALNNSIEELKSRNLDLSQLEHKQSVHLFTDIMREQLLQLSFEGVSGTIKFNDTTGFVSRGVDIEQLKERKLKRVMHFNGTHLLQTNEATLKFIKDNFDKFLDVPIWVTVLVLTITILISVLLVSLQSSSIVHRHAPSVKASSLKILHAAYIGSYLTIVSIVCESIATFLSSHRERKCHLEQASIAMVFLGMTLIFATICVRTWRLYCIFVHFVNPGIFVSDKALFMFISLCVVLELPVILAWCIVDPIKPTIVRNLDLEVGRIYCTSEYSYVWALSLLVYNIALLIVSCYFALRCNRINRKDFKSNSILNLAYILTIELAIGICIYFLSPQTHNPLPQYLAKNVTLLVYVFSCCALLFLSPVLPLLKSRLTGIFLCNFQTP